MLLTTTTRTTQISHLKKTSRLKKYTHFLGHFLASAFENKTLFLEPSMVEYEIRGRISAMFFKEPQLE